MANKARKTITATSNVVNGAGYLKQLEWLKTYLSYYKNMLNEKPWMLGNEKTLTEEMRKISKKIDSHIKTMQHLGAGRYYMYSTQLVKAQTKLNNSIATVIKRSLRSRVLRLNNSKEQISTEVFIDKVSDFATILEQLIDGLNQIKILELQFQKDEKLKSNEQER